MDSEGEKPLVCSAFAFGLSTPVHPFDVKRGHEGAHGRGAARARCDHSRVDRAHLYRVVERDSDWLTWLVARAERST